MSIYGLLAGIALFALIARHGDRLHHSLSSLIVVGGSTALTFTETAIVYGMDSALMMFTQLNSVAVIIVQLIVGYFIFRNIRNSADSDLPAYFGWVAAGWFLIFIATPFIVGKVF